MAKKNCVIGLLGVTLDRPRGRDRFKKWRPSISLCQQDDFEIDRFELLHQKKFVSLAGQVAKDIESVSPQTKVQRHNIEFDDPWDFEGVYDALANFAESYAFNESKYNYYAHVTTGTHVAQICTFLLVESRFVPATLVQSSPAKDSRGTIAFIDLDLAKYDRLSSRFSTQKRDDVSFLKSGIETKSKSFNALIDEVEKVAQLSKEPILLMGETGVGKSKLAGNIFALKKRRHNVSGNLVSVNCATLRGDNAMSALFGHVKGAFTSAEKKRAGLLKGADKGVLFLDEIGELGLEEQAMLLRALEEKTFIPVGADVTESSDFQLICGTNRNLYERVNQKKFRADLLARIDMWRYTLPPLRERREDIEANLDYEIARCEDTLSQRVAFNKEARAAFLRFAKSASWRGNFRDFHGAILRLATLCEGERITKAQVTREQRRLEGAWREHVSNENESDRILSEALGKSAGELDRFDKAQLADVITLCKSSKSLSEAGRLLFEKSRQKRTSKNDSDRLRKYLAKFGLTFDELKN